MKRFTVLIITVLALLLSLTACTVPEDAESADSADGAVHANAADEASEYLETTFSSGSGNIGNTTVRLKKGFDFVNTDSTQYHKDLALTAVTLSAQVYPNAAGDHAEAILDKLGYDKTDSLQVSTTTIPAVCFGYKSLGEGRNLFTVIVRGTSSLSDVLTDLYDGTYSMFENSGKHITLLLENFMSEATGKTKEKLKEEDNYFFLTGHSLGGAAVNYLSVNSSVMEYAHDKKDRIYTYTFESPHTCINLLWMDPEGMSNAFNLKVYDDAVTNLPPYIGSTTYGKDIIFKVDDLDDKLFNEYFPNSKGKTVNDAVSKDGHGDIYGLHDICLDLLYILKNGNDGDYIEGETYQSPVGTFIGEDGLIPVNEEQGVNINYITVEEAADGLYNVDYVNAYKRAFYDPVASIPVNEPFELSGAYKGTAVTVKLIYDGKDRIGVLSEKWDGSPSREINKTFFRTADSPEDAFVDNNITDEKEDPNVSAGDTVAFGAYEQDNDSGNGTEPIEWEILDICDGAALIVSKYALESKPFDDSRSNRVSWETSTLRSWLNADFYSTAFSPEEQECIVLTNVPAVENPYYFYEAENDTQDKVFLLSISEAAAYFDTNEDRLCTPTAYALSKGVSSSPYFGNSCWWWLRTSGRLEICTSLVEAGGSIAYDGDFSEKTTYAVRPAMWVQTGALRSPESVDEATPITDDSQGIISLKDEIAAYISCNYGEVAAMYPACKPQFTDDGRYSVTIPGTDLSLWFRNSAHEVNPSDICQAICGSLSSLTDNMPSSISLPNFCRSFHSKEPTEFDYESYYETVRSSGNSYDLSDHFAKVYFCRYSCTADGKVRGFNGLLEIILNDDYATEDQYELPASTYARFSLMIAG